MDIGDSRGFLVADHNGFSLSAERTIVPTRGGANPARFVFIDGLRGLAALAIVVFHIWWYEPDPYPTFEISHWVVDAAFLRIRAGVQVLLVISGFVIAHTLRNTWVTPREIVWFVGRRIIRLVPAYWVAIGSIIIVDLVCQKLGDLPSPFDGHLSVHRISAHMTFTQDILGHEALSAGLWTICIEMQFYIVAVLAWGLAQHLTRRPVESEPRPSMFGLLTVFVPFAFVSLFHWRPMESTTPWVIHFMWMFFLGMVTWWTLDQTVPRWFYAVVVLIAAGEIAFDADWWYENSVALGTAIAIFAAGRLGRLHEWLNWRWLQHLGKISYSLYLIHFPVCHLLISAGWKVFGDEPTPAQALTIFVVSFGASLFAAQLLYTWVEAPSNAVSAHLKRAEHGISLKHNNLSRSV